MDLKTYQELSLRTLKKGMSVTDQLHEAGHGIAGEVGEVVGEFTGYQLDYDKCKSELGDVVWYLAELANAYAMDLSVISTDKTRADFRTYYGALVNSLFLILITSSGQINEFLKKTIHHGKKMDAQLLHEPIKSMLDAINTLATCVDSSLEEILQTNVDKLKARYPDGFKPVQLELPLKYHSNGWTASTQLTRRENDVFMV